MFFFSVIGAIQMRYDDDDVGYGIRTRTFMSVGMVPYHALLQVIKTKTINSIFTTLA